MYGMTKTVSREEPDPTLPVIHDTFFDEFPSLVEELNLDPETARLVHEDVTERRVWGNSKYGTPLQPFDGNRPVVEAYQELMDATIYLCQSIMESVNENDRFRRQILYDSSLCLLFALREEIHREDQGGDQ